MKLQLTSNELGQLSQELGPVHFSHDFNFSYQKQIPQAGIVLLEGEIQLLKNNRIQETISPGFMLGIKNLLNEIPLKSGLFILKESKVIILNKTQILEGLKNPSSKLHWLMSKKEIFSSLKSASHLHKRKNDTYS